MKIYLAIPYSQCRALSYKIANKVAAQLMESGHNVFSPISHSHSVSPYIDKANHTHEFWMEQDLPFVEWADEVHVVVIGGYVEGHKRIARSKGVQEEIRHATRFNKPVQYIYYYDNTEGVTDRKLDEIKGSDGACP